jgi:hypothetical protein
LHFSGCVRNNKAKMAFDAKGRLPVGGRHHDRIALFERAATSPGASVSMGMTMSSAPRSGRRI